MCNRILEKKKCHFKFGKHTWLLSYKYTQQLTLRVRQWKILHNIYPTNILLSKMKIKENNKCSYCTDTVDVIGHFLSVVQLCGIFGIVLNELFCEHVPLM